MLDLYTQIPALSFISITNTLYWSIYTLLLNTALLLSSPALILSSFFTFLDDSRSFFSVDILPLFVDDYVWAYLRTKLTVRPFSMDLYTNPLVLLGYPTSWTSFEVVDYVWGRLMDLRSFTTPEDCLQLLTSTTSELIDAVKSVDLTPSPLGASNNALSLFVDFVSRASGSFSDALLLLNNLSYWAVEVFYDVIATFDSVLLTPADLASLVPADLNSLLAPLTGFTSPLLEDSDYLLAFFTGLALLTPEDFGHAIAFTANSISLALRELSCGIFDTYLGVLLLSTELALSAEGTLADASKLSSNWPLFIRAELPNLDILPCTSSAYFLLMSLSSTSTSGALGGVRLSLDYSTSDTGLSSSLNRSIPALQESTADQRFVRFINPVFQYNFKVGNYLPEGTQKLNPHLFNTLKDITMGIRKSSWFTSGDYSVLLRRNIASHTMYFGEASLFNVDRNSLAALGTKLDLQFRANAPSSVGVTFPGGFYNFFITMSSSPEVFNTRWLAVSALDQKFYRMFATGSMQQRIHANWRQLKFSREAWRCKLLAARHQNTLYKRYLNEDSVVWAIERNAKDLLPGWAMITPFSARTRFTAIGKVDIGLMGIFLVLNSSIVSSANFLVTYRYLSSLNNRKMRDARSFFTEGVMVASWMMIAANPMLAIGILMLLSDRHWQTSFFDYSGGGDTVLFQHMFWFFGHPEVYVIMIPAFGFNNTILSYYLRKRVSARASLLYSMYTIAFLGFFVWGHHMYMVGLAHTTRMLFSTLTVMISVPAATKLMHWCVTLVNSSFVLELPMFFQLLFIFFFVSGGISGMAVAHTGMDILFHDSFYVVGHFHVMLAGSAMFASFGAFYFYFPAIFGVKFSRVYGYLHAVYYLTGQLMTVVPMMWLGWAAMPRRVLDYPAALGGWHAIVSAGHLLSVAGMMAFFIMIFDSIRHSHPSHRNSLGVPRFSIRLNFYTYEAARARYLQRKGWCVSRFNKHNSVRMGGVNYTNHEYLETTLYSYAIINKPNSEYPGKRSTLTVDRWELKTRAEREAEAKQELEKEQPLS
jgi:hypothetical protein